MDDGPEKPKNPQYTDGPESTVDSSSFDNSDIPTNVTDNHEGIDGAADSDRTEPMDNEGGSSSEEEGRRQNQRAKFVDWFKSRRQATNNRRAHQANRQANWVSRGRLSRAETLTEQLHTNYLHGEKTPGKASSPETLAAHAITQVLHETGMYDDIPQRPIGQRVNDFLHGIAPVGDTDQGRTTAGRRIMDSMAPKGHRVRNKLEQMRNAALEGVLRELGYDEIDMDKWGTQVHPAVIKDFKKYWVEGRHAEGLHYEAAYRHINNGGVAAVYRYPEEFEDFFDVDFKDFEERGEEVIPGNVYRAVNTLLKLPTPQLDALAAVAGPAPENPYEWINNEEEKDEFFEPVKKEAEAARARATLEERIMRSANVDHRSLEDKLRDKAEQEENEAWILGLGYIAGDFRSEKNRGKPLASVSVKSFIDFLNRARFSEDLAREVYAEMQRRGIVAEDETPGKGFLVDKSSLDREISEVVKEEWEKEDKEREHPKNDPIEENRWRRIAANPRYQKYFEPDSLHGLHKDIQENITPLYDKELQRLNAERQRFGESPLDSLPPEYAQPIFDQVDKEKTSQYLSDNDASPQLMQAITQARLYNERLLKHQHEQEERSDNEE